MERLTLTVSDPWDFVSEAGSNVFITEVHTKREATGQRLLHLPQPVHMAGTDWHWFVATPVPDGSWALSGLRQQQATSEAWPDESARWRGGTPAARGTLG